MVANTPHGKILLIRHKMATFSLDEFRSRLSNLGIARPNRFQVILPELGNGSALPSLFCESSSLPPLAVLTRSQRIQGPLHQRASNLDYGGGGISMTFYVDSNMDVKKYFDTWVHMTVNPASFTVNYYNDYAKDIMIYQLDEKDNEKYSIRLVEAFPTSLGIMELNQGSNDTVHRLTVTFSYRYWSSDTIKQTEEQINTNTYDARGRATAQYDPRVPGSVPLTNNQIPPWGVSIPSRTITPEI